jgi:hypothetical protein
VSMMDDKLMCVILRNGQRHPTAMPRPTLQAVTLQVPFMDLGSKVAQLEEEHARCSLLWFNDDHGGMATASKYFTSKQEVTLDKTALALFARALQLDRSSRALDLCTMIHRKKSLEIGVQIASHANKAPLVSRITMLAQLKFPAAQRARTTSNLGAADDDDYSSLLDAPAAPTSKRGTLRRPVTLDEDSDEGEAEFGNTPSAAAAASTKRKFDDGAAANGGSQLSSSSFAQAPASASQSVKKIQSANVKAKPAAAATPASQKANPFANSQGGK